MTIDTKPANTFFTTNVRFIVPIPLLALAGMSLWDALHTGNTARYLAAMAFSGVALLTYWSQRQLYRQRQRQGQARR